MGLDLEAADVDALEERTEGWIAGLQLAALSLRAIPTRPEVADFIEAFTGSNRFVIDYLADEVLARQPTEVRDFLLRTAVLDRLTGPLCDAVSGQSGGTAMLADLDRANLFLVPLDTERSWYRYHHLFADVLHARLLAEDPHLVPQLHRRASDWYASHGLVADAVRHALVAEDFTRAAYLMEEALPDVRRAPAGQPAAQLGPGLAALRLRRSPVLSIAGGLGADDDWRPRRSGVLPRRGRGGAGGRHARSGPGGHMGRHRGSSYGAGDHPGLPRLPGPGPWRRRGNRATRAARARPGRTRGPFRARWGRRVPRSGGLGGRGRR